ncbi:MAG: phage Gp37/Gp68 family protein [Candidatus Fermentibacteraceae bacterium]|nr:phage Gp37/Gp68 family protein [Candidatus Fermentibacteraceae bacterium]MBN2607879.1 phage Gp37/Gp68 family protein [Candidatus Fermentibacteraceae bacterium]
MNKPRHETWNPVTGCSPVSEGCDHCYARGIALRLRDMGVARYSEGFSVVVHEDVIEKPLHWRDPRIVFVTSMGDLMHPEVPEDFINRVFDVMRRCARHQFQLLSKRPERMAGLCRTIDWPANVWAGTTVENRSFYHRLENLRRVDSAIRFISFEPLLGDVSDVDLTGIHWAAVGGESGPEARPMRIEWARGIRDRCVREGIAFYFKQWGGRHHSSGGRMLDGRTWDQSPDPSGQMRLGL